MVQKATVESSLSNLKTGPRTILGFERKRHTAQSRAKEVILELLLTPMDFVIGYYNLSKF